MRRAIGCFMLGVFAPLVGAEDLHREDATTLAPIQITAGRHEGSTFEVAQPLTVLDAEEISARNAQVMTEALRYEPGAFFQQTGPGQGIVIVRGLKGAEVLHLVDGVRLNNAFFRTAPSQYIALLDPANMERLELLRGPYATVYGSDAMGGVVQVLTPEHRFATTNLGWKAGAKAHWSSADLARTARTYAATGNRTFSVSAGFSFADYGKRLLAQPGQSADGVGGFSLADRVNDTDYLSRGYDFKALWAPSANQELMFSAQHFTLPNLPRYNETVPGYRASGLPAVAASIYDNDRAFYHLRYRYTAPLAFMDSFEIHFARQVVNDDRLDREQNLSRDTFEYNRSTLTGFTAQAVSQLGAHRMSYGLELYRDDIDSRSVRETPPDSGNQVSNSPGGFASRFPDGAQADDYGIYALDEWSFAKDWRFDAGIRYGRHETELPQADRAFGATLEDDDVTGNLGLRYAITRGLAWTFNAGRGYRSPNINDLAQVGRRSGNRIVVANFDLKPESILSADTGIKFASGGLTGEATLFYSDYKDRITLVSPAFAEGTAECPDDENEATDGCAQNQNITEAMYYGFEGGVRYAITSRWALRGVLNYTFGQQESGGRKTPGNRVPPLNGRFVVEYKPLPSLRIEPWVFFASNQDRLDPTDLADARINPNGTAGYAVWNLRARWQALKWLDLQLDGYNLADKFYREHGSGIEGPARGIAVTAAATF